MAPENHSAAIARLEQRVSNHDDHINGRDGLWTSVNALREKFSDLRVQIALIVGGLNGLTTIAVAWIVKSGRG